MSVQHHFTSGFRPHPHDHSSSSSVSFSGLHILFTRCQATRGLAPSLHCDDACVTTTRALQAFTTTLHPSPQTLTATASRTASCPARCPTSHPAARWCWRQPCRRQVECSFLGLQAGCTCLVLQAVVAAAVSALACLEPICCRPRLPLPLPSAHHRTARLGCCATCGTAPSWTRRSLPPWTPACSPTTPLWMCWGEGCCSRGQRLQCEAC